MRKLKTIDYKIQWVLIIGGVILTLVFAKQFFNYFFFGAYFIVGGWQIVSVIVHFFLPPETRGRQRIIYLWCLATVVSLGLVAIGLDDYIIFYLFGLLIASPLMAIFYAFLCMNEAKALDPPLLEN